MESRRFQSSPARSINHSFNQSTNHANYETISLSSSLQSNSPPNFYSSNPPSFQSANRPIVNRPHFQSSRRLSQTGTLFSQSNKQSNDRADIQSSIPLEISPELINDSTNQTINQTVRLSVHNKAFSNDELVINPRVFPTLTVGSIIAITRLNNQTNNQTSNQTSSQAFSQSSASSLNSSVSSSVHQSLNQSTIYLRVNRLEAVKGNIDLSIDQSIATACGFGSRDLVEVQSINPSNYPSINLEAVEFSFERSYVGRSDHFRVRSALQGQTLSINQSINLFGMKFKVDELTRVVTDQSISQPIDDSSDASTSQSTSQSTISVKSGLINPSTKFTFRSKSARLFLLVQLSEEMWEYSDDQSNNQSSSQSSEIYFEKVVRFVRKLLCNWSSTQSSHTVSIILFSRTFMQPISRNKQLIDESNSQSESDDELEDWASDDEQSIKPDSSETYFNVDNLGRVYADHYALVVDNESPPSGAQSINQTISQTITSSIKQLNNQSNNQSNSQYNQSANLSSNQDDAQAWADSICVKLKQRFFDYPNQLRWEQSIQIPIEQIHYDRLAVNQSTNQSIYQLINQSVNQDGLFVARRVASSAVDGNLLESINLSSSVYDHHFIDRDLNRTGQNLVILTAGVGLLSINQSISQSTKQRMVDAGIGCDLVSVARPPLHAVPLFVYAPKFLEDPHKYVHDNVSINQLGITSNNQLKRSKSLHRMDSQSTGEDYYVPHWISLYFLDRPNENQSINQSINQTNNNKPTNQSITHSNNQPTNQDQSDSFSLLSTVRLYDFRVLQGESLSDWLFKPRGTINQSSEPCIPNHDLQSKYTQPRPLPRIDYNQSDNNHQVSNKQSVHQPHNHSNHRSNKQNMPSNRSTYGSSDQPINQSNEPFVKHSINKPVNPPNKKSKKPYQMPAAHLDYDQSIFSSVLHRAGDSNISLKSMSSSLSLQSPTINQSTSQPINQQSVNKALATSGSFNHLPVLDSFSGSFAWRLTFARRWAHLFTTDRLMDGSVDCMIDGYAINWKSLIKPALLPLTVDYSPSATELKQFYREYVYTLTLDQSLNQTNNQSINQITNRSKYHTDNRSHNQTDNHSSDSELEMLQELVCQRLAHDFQLISKPAHISSNQSTQLINQPINLSTNPSTPIQTIHELDTSNSSDQAINDVNNPGDNELIIRPSITVSNDQSNDQTINPAVGQSIAKSISPLSSPTNKVPRTPSSGSSLMRLFQRKRRIEPELIDQSSNYSNNQPVRPSRDRLTSSGSFNQSVTRPNSQMTVSAGKLNQPFNNQINHVPVNQSISRDRIINPTINQSINQSINQPPVIEYWLALRNTVHCLWLERYSGVVNVKRYLHDRAIKQPINPSTSQSIDYHYYLHSPLIDRFQLASRSIEQSNVDQTDWNFADQLITSRDADYDANDMLRYRRIRLALIPQQMSDRSNNQSNNQVIKPSINQSAEFDRSRIDSFLSLMKTVLNIETVPPIIVASTDPPSDQTTEPIDPTFIVPRQSASMPHTKDDRTIDKELEAEFGFAYRGVTEVTDRVNLSTNQSNNQSNNQSFFLRYETFYHPRFAYHFEIHWLVAIGQSISEWLRVMTRKAEKSGFHLVKIPSAQATVTADPFHAPVRLRFNASHDHNIRTLTESGTTEWTRQELHRRLLGSCGFVLDCQVHRRTFYLHSTGAALIRSMSDSLLFVANPTDSRALAIFQSVHRHWDEVIQCRDAMLAIIDDIEIIVQHAGQL